MPLLETLTFFIDRSLGRTKVAQALRSVGTQVIIHDDIFTPDARDEEWLARAGADGWVVLTKDRRIRYRAIEREALTYAGVRAFVLTAGSLSGEAMGQAFVAAMGAMRTLIAREPAPFIAAVSRSGTVTLIGKRNERTV